MSTFFVAAVVPANWKTASSDLRIDPKEYQARLLSQWPDTEFLSSPTLLLEWSLFMRSEDGSSTPLGIGGLHSDRQTVSMDTPVEEFFLWHRLVVPEMYRLYLFEGGNPTRFLELTAETTAEELGRFLGPRR